MCVLQYVGCMSIHGMYGIFMVLLGRFRVMDIFKVIHQTSWGMLSALALSRDLWTVLTELERAAVVMWL